MKHVTFMDKHVITYSEHLQCVLKVAKQFACALQILFVMLLSAR